MAARQDLVDDGSGKPASEQMSAGLVDYWTTWADEGIGVLAIADPPYNGEVRNADCVLLNSSDPVACARPRAEAQPADPVLMAGAAERSDSITVLDLTDRFCDAERCYAVIGGVPVYYDADHLNLEYVRMLAPEITAAIEEVLSDG